MKGNYRVWHSENLHQSNRTLLHFAQIASFFATYYIAFVNAKWTFFSDFLYFANFGQSKVQNLGYPPCTTECWCTTKCLFSVFFNLLAKGARMAMVFSSCVYSCIYCAKIYQIFWHFTSKTLSSGGLNEAYPNLLDFGHSTKNQKNRKNNPIKGGLFWKYNS